MTCWVDRLLVTTLIILIFAPPLAMSCSGQSVPLNTISHQPWGPWMTHPGHPGIKSRARCQYTTTSSNISMWAIEFKNDYPYAVDIIAAWEGFDIISGTNKMMTPGLSSMQSGQISPVAYNTTLHGSCRQISGITVDVKCAVPKGEVERCYTEYHLPRPTPENSPNLGRVGTASSEAPPSSPKVDDPFSRARVTCYIAVNGTPDAATPNDSALLTLTTFKQTSNQGVPYMITDLFELKDNSDGTVAMLGHTVPATIAKGNSDGISCGDYNGKCSTDSCYERTWTIVQNGVDLPFSDCLHVDQSGSVDSSKETALIVRGGVGSFITCQHQ